MDIESLIKKIFPTYKIYNATDKSEQHMHKIIDICINIDNLIVFKLRNDSEKRNTISCGKCGSYCCTKCIFNMSSRNDNVICPMCRSCTLVCNI